MSDYLAGEIEKYLLAKYTPFSHPYLQKTVESLQLIDSEEPITLDELAQELKISRQTLTVQFKK